jgi:glycosyltransferase involved in cell wall biosynthesis
MTPRFSIIIPTYNYASTLPRAVSSVLQQTGNDYEIIIINDGSTDNTAEIITKLQQQTPDIIRDFSQPNAGVATARNHGIKESRGQYLLFLDADDALMPDALPILRNVLEARKNAEVVIGAHIKVEMNGKEKYCGNSALSSNPEKRFADYLDKKVSISNGAILFARHIFDKLKFPEQFRSAEDVPVFAQAIALFNTVGVEDPLVKIYRNPTSLRHDADSALAIGLNLVDAVFNPAILPAPFMKYKKAFLVRRCLSLFRTLAAAGYKQQARAYYHLAVKEDWHVLFKMEYWRKYLLVMF